VNVDDSSECSLRLTANRLDVFKEAAEFCGFSDLLRDKPFERYEIRCLDDAAKSENRSLSTKFDNVSEPRRGRASEWSLEETKMAGRELLCLDLFANGVIEQD
jgi:hypothetical protein